MSDELKFEKQGGREEGRSVTVALAGAPAPRILTGGAEKQQGTEIQGETALNNLFFDALTIKIHISDGNQTELLDFIKFFSMELQTAPSDPIQGANAYASSLIYECEEGKVILSFGGAVENMGVLIETKGYASCLLVSTIINTMPPNTWALTRADIAADFQGGKKTFRSIHRKLIAYARDNRITSKNQMGDWIDNVGGRTQYIGSPSSESRFRLYEKSEERWANGEKDYPEGIVRLEWQYRPKRKRKHIAQLYPDYVLSFSKNAVKLFKSIMDLSVVPIKTPKAVKKDDLERLYYGIEQYGNLIESLIDSMGRRKLMRLVLRRLAVRESIRGGGKEITKPDNQ